MDKQRIDELRLELQAERISNEELAEIESAFAGIPNSELGDLRENAMASDMLDAIESHYSAAPTPMTRYKVTMEIEAPSHVSYEHVREWARFELHDIAGMNLSNPLCDTPVEPSRFTITVKH